METLKTNDKYTIFKKRSGRFAIIDAAGKAINGLDKAKILVENKLVQIDVSKKPAAAE